MKITIDHKSGFCSGVTSAIHAAEAELKKNKKLYCLGDLVHNNIEMERLKNLGLVVITTEQFKKLKNEKILIRAHGEPPETYKIAKENNLTLLDYTCPVVLKLQQNIKKGFEQMEKIDGQVVIYGKEGHAEVIGLNGQINDKAVIISNHDDKLNIDFSKPVILFSQTTKDESGFFKLAELIKQKMQESGVDADKNLIINNTICRSVSKRVPLLEKFASEHDVIIFVSGIKSSNGQYLFSVCKKINLNSFMISNASELNKDWIIGKNSVGICGATSTPMWLMQDVAEKIKQY